MRRNGLAAVTVLAAALLLGTASAHAQSPGPALEPCPELPAALNAQCGSITVPLDRANPDLGTTRIAFAVVPRRDTSRPSLGTLVGPHGLGAALIPATPQLVADFGPLLNRRDLLVMDARGVGGSDPIVCRSLDGVTTSPLTPPERLTDAIGACGRELGPRVGAYGMAAVADDLDAVRAALGIERLDLWGRSYGTHLMIVYAGRHPDHVRSIMLSGSYPLDYAPFAPEKLAAAHRGVRLMCARTRACDGDAVLRDVARLATRLRRDPVDITVRAGGLRAPLRLDDGALASVQWGGGDTLFLGRLPAAVRSALAGDLAPLRRLVETPALVSASPLAPSGGGGSSGTAAFAAACHDFPRAFSYASSPEVRRSEYAAALAAVDVRDVAPFSREGWVRAGFEAPDWCLDWPADPTAVLPLAPDAPLPDVPVLVLAGDMDANTPSSNGRDVAARFPGATFVEIPNAGHTPDFVNPCAAAMARRFTRTLTVDADACDGTGTPPAVAGRAPVRAAELPLAPSNGTRPQRRALSLVLATVADMQEQSNAFVPWGSARGLRGGRYAVRADGTVRLTAVRVVRDATVSGALTAGAGVSGSVRLAGPGVVHGTLRLRVSASGRTRAVGTLDGRAVDLRIPTT